MYLNGQELNNDTLIDNDADTCVSVPGYNGCNMDKVTIQDIQGNVCTGVCVSFGSGSGVSTSYASWDRYGTLSSGVRNPPPDNPPPPQQHLVVVTET